MYDDEPPRRRRSIVPILAIVAAVLAIAVGIAVVLFALGYFDRTPPSTATQVSTDATRQTEPQTLSTDQPI